MGTLFFAINQPMVPLAIAELPKAVLHLPLAFQRGPDGLNLVAVCSLDGAVNECISAQHGLWAKGYVPNVIGVHPFGLLTEGESGQVSVGVATNSDWLSTTEGEPRFHSDGQPSAILANKLEVLRTGLPNAARDAPALAPLEELGLLAAWQQLPGELLLIDQTRLAGLTPAELARLRDSNSLALAYAQLFSMGHVPALTQIAHHNAQWRAHKTKDWELDATMDTEMRLVFD